MKIVTGKGRSFWLEVNDIQDAIDTFGSDSVVYFYNAFPASADDAETPPAWTDVLLERRRQVEVEGWHHARDDMYTDGELARAGSAYAAASTYYHADPYAAVLSIWPWDRSWLKPTSPRRDLVKAAALILAEIERLDRAAPTPEVDEKAKYLVQP